MTEKQQIRWTFDCNRDGIIDGVSELLVVGFDEPRTALPLPYHEHNGFEFVLVERGRVGWELGGSLYETGAGDVFHTAPGELHRAGYNAIEPSRFWWLIVTPPEKDHWLRLPPKEIKQFSRAFAALPRVVHTGLDPVVSFGELRRSLMSATLLQSTMIRNALLGLLLQIVHPKQLAAGIADDLRQPLSALIQRIEAEPEWRPSVDEMAACIRISPSHFFRCFQDYTGFSPMAYLERSRVKKACERLVGTDDSVTVISGELGYASSQHFATAFKRLTGMTPLQWRKSQGATTR